MYTDEKGYYLDIFWFIPITMLCLFISGFSIFYFYEVGVQEGIKQGKYLEAKEWEYSGGNRPYIHKSRGSTYYVKIFTDINQLPKQKAEK